MADRIKVDFSIINKRQSCLNSAGKSSDINAEKILENANSQIKHNRFSTSIVKQLSEVLSNHDNANKYYIDALYIMEELNNLDLRLSDYFVNEYTKSVLPYVEDLSTISESVDRYDLRYDQTNKILETASKYVIADRILSNHNKISKRFNISNEVKKLNRGMGYFVESCCSMIDTYSITPYAKFNLSLEEMGYLLDKNAIKYDKNELVKECTKYFLLRNDINSKSLKGFRTVLNENSYIDEDNLKVVSFLAEEQYETSERNNINSEIDKFLLSQDKSIENITYMIINSMNSNVMDIKFNLNKLIIFIWDLYRSDLFSIEEIDSKLENWFGIIYKRLSSNLFQEYDGESVFSKADLAFIINNLGRVNNLLISGFTDSKDYCIRLEKFKSCIYDFKSNVEQLIFSTYSANNLKNIEFVNSESVKEVTLNEYKAIEFKNLVRATNTMDRLIRYKERVVLENFRRINKNPIKKIKEFSFDQINPYSTIGSDCKADICLAQYLEENNIVEIQEYLENICNAINNKLIVEHYDDLRAYYIINPGIAEIHLKDRTRINLTEEEYNIVNSSYDESFDTYLEEFSYIVTCLEQMSLFNESELNIEERLVNFFNNEELTTEHFEVALEALSFLDVSNDQISLFTENFINYRYNTALLESVITEDEYNREKIKINSIMEKWEKVENASIYDQLEAFQILSAVLEDTNNVKKQLPKVGPSNNKPVNNTSSSSRPVQSNNSNQNNSSNNNSEVEKKKNPFAGINLKSMKLYLEGIKSKMKVASGKEKEICRNLDNTFRLFVKSMKDALISDRREAVIKGSVIPSFSKCIKIAVVLAGVGIITQNPLVPLLLAFGGFAVSKHLTKKERVLLLDELEVEMQVIEKEINAAESKNQMKKYRALLKYKKDLQRQYQRIKYNIKVGKDIMPGSTAGVKKFDD